ncbi:MAG: hypothetical protein ACRDZ4_00150 [Egibacteraceae bacterium]
MLVIGYVVYLLALARRAADPEISASHKMRAAICGAIPDSDFLADYFSSTLFSHSSLPELRALNPHHHLSLYVKNFRISGTDIRTHEEYHGQNLGSQVSTGFRLVTFGGSSLKLEELKRRAHQVDGGVRYAVNLATCIDQERFKILTVQFRTPLNIGESFCIEYDEFWPRAMTWGTDAVSFAQILFYPRGISKVQSRLTFDSLVSSIGAYWFDLDSGECSADLQQPKMIAKDNEACEYEWSVINPPNSRLYFMIHARPLPDQSANDKF